MKAEILPVDTLTEDNLGSVEEEKVQSAEEEADFAEVGPEEKEDSDFIVFDHDFSSGPPVVKAESSPVPAPDVGNEDLGSSRDVFDGGVSNEPEDMDTEISMAVHDSPPVSALPALPPAANNTDEINIDEDPGIHLTDDPPPEPASQNTPHTRTIIPVPPTPIPAAPAPAPAAPAPRKKPQSISEWRFRDFVWRNLVFTSL